MKHTPPRTSRFLLAVTTFAALAMIDGGELFAQTTPGPQPSICSRGCWNARSGSASEMSALNRAVIHHTAGTGDYNVSSQSQSAAKVRAIQNLHMDVNGWGDIGYHFLVDKLGNTFEGRVRSMNTSQRPRGAHDGNNTNSFGFNVMGYYHPPYNQSFTTASRNALWDVIAWRLPSGWSPYGSGSYNGKTVGRVAGHRNVKSTACPGDGVYALIGTNYSGGTARNAIASRRTGGPPPSSDEADNSALITDPSGNVWFAAVKADNDLYTRRYDASADTWNSFTSHGTGWSRFAAPALVAQTDGTVRLIAVKSDGTMWSRKWTSSGGWSGFSQQGSGGWAVNAGPVAVRQTSGEITFAAVKQSGALHHRTYNPATDTWGGFGSHSTAWSNDAAPCLIAGSDGKLWLFAVKADGRIYHRSWTSSGGWTGFYEDGAGSWSADAGPVGCAKANGDISWAAVKANGALYMRHLDGGSWAAFGAHSTAWSADASPSVAYGSDGKIWLFAVKQDGTTYHQSWNPVSGWTAWYQDGAYSDWSINVGPVVATRPNGAITWIGTKEDGVMYTRFLTGSWEAFVNQGSNWSK